MKRIIACQECRRQWDVTRYAVGQKLRCVCAHVMEVPRIQSYTPDVHHCAACGAARPPTSDPCGYCGAVPEEEAARLSLVCPFCFHRTPGKSRYCSTCGEAIRPARLDAKTGNLKCPRCVRPRLVSRKIGSVSVDECPTCSGMWTSSETFTRLVRQQAAREEEERLPSIRSRGPKKSKLTENVRYIKCPECQRIMNRFNFARVSGVIVDECRAHGVWLDADELGKIATYVSTGGLQHTQRIEEEEAARRRLRASPAPPGSLVTTVYSAGRDGAGSEPETPLGAVLELLGRLF